MPEKRIAAGRNESVVAGCGSAGGADPMERLTSNAYQSSSPPR